MNWNELKQEITSLSEEEKEMIELTALLASYRKEKKMTQEELAEKTNLTQAQIARIENFSQSPSLRTLSKVASGLDLKITFVDKNTRELMNH
ncbi:helix-turn-helix domain-containing protein [Alkalibacterium sp. 20]|uniref:helix-turn-helix domain-containing protein n=1 Tax=Alkalibacterium sp. 20 TaxID=1798803 RepID=UPI00091FCE16|nr:helix-turn-helix transcriptional regulator [Alkalibacterium sp. 20]OJF91686.1 hypothetical protein AX762_10910 [Alkalibacterium sp. 20]